MKYIFIDESGDLGDSYSSSKHFETLAIYLDKQNLDRIPSFYKHHALYDEIASKLAEKIKISSPTCIIVDKSKFNPMTLTILMINFHLN